MAAVQREVAVFGGGCFWCTEAVFQNLRGVLSAKPGYAGGFVKNPTYRQVSSGETGHAEATRIEFDPSQISYNDLLTVFFATHDPTTSNRQGNDVGTQYRSVIFYATAGQKTAAEEFVKKLDEGSGKPVVTELMPLTDFYGAEDYHHNYYENHKNQSYCAAIINPKLKKLREKFKELLKPGQNEKTTP